MGRGWSGEGMGEGGGSNDGGAGGGRGGPGRVPRRGLSPREMGAGAGAGGRLRGEGVGWAAGTPLALPAAGPDELSKVSRAGGPFLDKMPAGRLGGVGWPRRGGHGDGAGAPHTHPELLEPGPWQQGVWPARLSPAPLPRRQLNVARRRRPPRRPGAHRPPCPRRGRVFSVSPRMPPGCPEHPSASSEPGPAPERRPRQPSA